MKNKNTAGLLALFLGWLGVHRFYLKQTGLGVFYIILMLSSARFAAWLLPLLVIADAAIFFTMSREDFDRKYNKAEFRRKRDKGEYRSDKRKQKSPRQGDRKRPQQRRKPQAKAAPRRQVPKKNPYKELGKKKFKDYDYEGAIEDFKKALELNPKDIAAHFNIACAYSLMEETEKSFFHLDKAVALGFNDFDKIRTHDAFAYLRVQDGFDAFADNGFRIKEKEAVKKSITEEEEQMNPDLLEQLNKLAELRSKGLLTLEEFELEKKKLMA